MTPKCYKKFIVTFSLTVSTTPTPSTTLPTTYNVTTDISTSHTESTNSPTTEKIGTTTAQTPYNCLDVTVDHCRDETLEEIQTFPGIESLLNCQAICDVVYRDLCNSYIYHKSTKTVSYTHLTLPTNREV